MQSPEREDRSEVGDAPTSTPIEASGYATEQCRAWLRWSAAQIEACLNGELAARDRLLVSLGEVLLTTSGSLAEAVSAEKSAVIVAVQSHDRLTQTLNHVVQSLRALHEQMGDPCCAGSPESWRALRDSRLRAFSMREERALFVALVAQQDQRAAEGDMNADHGVELFTDHDSGDA
jgi:hypothetical protein